MNQKRNLFFRKSIGLLLSFALVFSAAAFCGCSNNAEISQFVTTAADADTVQDATEYSSSVVPLSRNGVELHLERLTVKNTSPERNILLAHGVTYSSHEFDVDYKDYSLVRFLAREGYAVWRLDIAGFGRSGEVKDGFISDSDYAAEDINAAVEKIVSESGQNKIDVLGWSWGTVTASRLVIKNPGHIGKLVLTRRF